MQRDDVTDTGVACALDGPGLEERLREWAELDQALLRRDTDADRVRAVYRNARDIRARLDRLVELEGRCCGGTLRFAVAERGPELHLEITLRPGVPGRVDEVLGILGTPRR